MKKLIITSILALLIAAGTTKAQNRPDEYLGLPGDNLNLYAVMKLFQESQTLEDFERKLNDENSRINNLDLNGDNLIDYIMVKDYPDGNVHNIVLQVALNQNEKQDVAVFTVQRFNNGTAQIQLIGDEALYGKNYIIEPIYADNSGGTPNPGYSGSGGYGNDINVVSSTGFDIAAWPLIRFMYLPGYVAWNSSWYWGYYPSYWHPWRPFFWDYYYGYQHSWYPEYYSHYHHGDYYRYSRYNDFYYSGIRSHSRMVSNGIRGGNYRATYSHPEQRRDGEALYSRMHSHQDSRRADNNSFNNNVRRSGSESSRDRNYSNTNSGSYRRSGSTMTERSGSNPYSGQRADASRRSSSTMTDRTGSNPYYAQRADASRRPSSTMSDRSGTNPYSGQRADASRRSTSTMTDRTGSNPYSGQRAYAYRGSSSTVNERSGSNPYSGQRADASRRSSPTVSGSAPSRNQQGSRGETARSSRQSTSRVSSSNQRSGGGSKAGNSGNRRSNSKESDNSKSSHR